MKKLIFAIAVAGSLFLSACSNDEMMAPGAGTTDGTVTFTFTPEAALSRAYSDGLTATTLHYAAYEAGTKTVIYTSENASDPAATLVSDRNFTLSLNLVKGKSYDFVFWADKGDGAPYTFSAADQSVTVDYTAPVAGNDEGRDAFFQAVKDLKVTGPMEQPVVLRRPFAQVNIGTSDLAEAAKLNTTIASTAFTVSGVHSSLDLFTGIAAGSAEVTFAATALPQGESFPNVKEGVSYDYIAMNYILTGTELEADTDVQRAKSELMNASLTMVYNDGKSQTIKIDNMPVQRNYRTNIFGALLTAPLDFTITVDQEYNDPDHNYSELLFAAQNGGIVTLSADVTFPQSGTSADGALNYLTVAAGKRLVVDLNGNNIEGGFLVEGELVLKGDGSVNGGEGNATQCVNVAAGGKATIEGGSFVAGTDANGDSNSAIYTRGGAVIIRGGHFEAQKAYNGRWYVLNVQNGSGGTITATGGTFVNQNPSLGDDVDGGSFVATGYSAIEVEGAAVPTWEVVEGVNTPEGMVESIADPDVPTVKVLDDLDLTAATPEQLTFETPKTIEITDGKTLTIPAGSAITASEGLTITGGTITNAAATGANARSLDTSDTRCLIIVENGDLTLNGVTLINDMDFHLHGEEANNAAITYIGKCNVNLTDCKVYSGGYTVCGWRFPDNTSTLYFKDCHFESNSSNKHGHYAYTLRLNGKTGVMENCTVKGVQGGLSVERGLEMTVRGGSYRTVNSEGNMDAFYAVYATNLGKVIVESGEFVGANNWGGNLTEGTSALTSGDNDVNSPYGTFELRGGKYSGKAYNHNTKLVYQPAEGYVYRALEGEGDLKWEVVKE